MDALLTSLQLTMRQLVVVAGPLIVMAFLLHVVERLLSSRLISRFGWRGVLMTGWLGVPVHELSHALACVLFRHRVERLRLFSPDPHTGRLGSVQHAWNRRSLYQQVGRFFIGIAPIVGGTLVLWWLSWVFASLSPMTIEPPHLPPGSSLFALAGAAANGARELIVGLARPEVLSSGWTWLYLYLCLCVGAHLAPSSSDLRGGAPGFALLLVLVFVANLWATWAGASARAGEQLVLDLSAPVLGLLVLALVLGSLCLALVTLLTLPLRERRI